MGGEGKISREEFFARYSRPNPTTPYTNLDAIRPKPLLNPIDPPPVTPNPPLVARPLSLVSPDPAPIEDLRSTEEQGYIRLDSATFTKKIPTPTEKTPSPEVRIPPLVTRPSPLITPIPNPVDPPPLVTRHSSLINPDPAPPTPRFTNLAQGASVGLKKVTPTNPTPASNFPPKRLTVSEQEVIESLEESRATLRSTKSINVLKGGSTGYGPISLVALALVIVFGLGLYFFVLKGSVQNTASMSASNTAVIIDEAKLASLPKDEAASQRFLQDISDLDSANIDAFYLQAVAPDLQNSDNKSSFSTAIKDFKALPISSYSLVEKKSGSKNIDGLTSGALNMNSLVFKNDKSPKSNPLYIRLNLYTQPNIPDKFWFYGIKYQQDPTLSALKAEL